MQITPPLETPLDERRVIRSMCHERLRHEHFRAMIIAKENYS